MKLDFIATFHLLIQGAAVLLIAVYLIGLLKPFLPTVAWIRDTVTGLMYGAATVLGMALAIKLSDGVFFDARSMILGVGSAFGGPVVGLVAGLCAGLFRLYLGGAGTYIGLSVIAASVAFGTGFYFLARSGRLDGRFFEFLVFGFLVHLVAVVLFAFLPGMTVRETVAVIGFPVLAAFTPMTAVLCSMLWSQKSRESLVAQLSSNTEYVRSLFDLSPVAQVSSAARDGTILTFNAALSRLTGYSPDELAAMKVFDLYAESAQGKERAKVLFKRFQNGEAFDGEKLDLHRKNGEIRCVQLSVNPVTNEFGVVTESRAALIDVTEVEKAERAAEASWARLSRLLDQVTDPIILYDKNLRIQFANAAFLTLTDRTLEELVGKRDKEAWPPQIYSQYINELEETFKTGSIRVVELKQSFKLEDTRDLVLVMHPVIDVDGRVVEAFITFDDRTDLVLAEGEKIRLEVERATLEKTLYKALLDTINAISLTVEKRDPYTAGHQNRVAQLSVAIAERLGWDPHRIEGLRLGAMIHDMGKIYVPSEILNRPGKLTNDEFNLIKAHPRVGEEIISAISFPWPVAEMVCQHHERIDGSGYPYGLKGDRIVEEAKIIAVADVVEAITSHRPYRPALGLEEGLAEIEGGRGTKYAAEYVDACVALIRNEGFTFS